MFNLMTDTDCLPMEEERIVQIHKGMNKFRVSVGEHVSEPSEVHIVTGEDEDRFRSFIVFFMVEPEIHVIYGFDGNPYDRDSKEDVLNDAFQFVEEMGAILEEIPWEGMSPEERLIWISKGTLYPQQSPDEEGDLIEELEEIRSGELLEVLEDDEPVEVEAMDPEPEEPEAEDEEQEEEGDDLIEEGPIDEDGDFDHLLKQAFLKPDLVKKSAAAKARSGKAKPPEDDAPEDKEDISDSHDEFEAEGPGDADIEEAGTAAEIMREAGDDCSPDTVEEEQPSVTEAVSGKTPEDVDNAPSFSGDRTVQMVIRFLSRF